ncbi:unnamed protein product, partial [Effrenium voratum]
PPPKGAWTARDMNLLLEPWRSPTASLPRCQCGAAWKIPEATHSPSWERSSAAASAGCVGAIFSTRHRSRLLRAARGGDAKAPPEPRARGPRSERDVANDVVFGVVAVDLLFNHDRLDMEVGEAFRRSVYDPAWKRLRYYADPTAPEARSPAKSWRLQDRTLERQFSLSRYYTGRATQELELSRNQDPLMPAMQRTSRSLLEEAGVRATDDPVSNALIAWMAHNVTVGDESSCRHLFIPFGHVASIVLALQVQARTSACLEHCPTRTLRRCSANSFR